MTFAIFRPVALTRTGIISLLLLTAFLALNLEYAEINVQGFTPNPPQPGLSSVKEYPPIGNVTNPPPSGFSEIEESPSEGAPPPSGLSSVEEYPPISDEEPPPSGLSSVEEYPPISDETLPLPPAPPSGPSEMERNSLLPNSTLNSSSLQ
jgi:hypothetical protein